MDSFNKNKTIIKINKILKENGIVYGEQVIYHCPKCHHRKPKLEVSLKDGIFHCWVCNYSGRLWKLFKENGADENDLEYISNTYSNKKYKNYKNNKNNSNLTLPKEYVSLSEKINDRSYISAINYCKSRKLTLDDIIKYNIGYCKTGKYSNRIIIPSYDENGELNYFIGRDYSGNNLKYLCPNVDKDIIGFDLFINWDIGFITLCEGIFDAISIKHNAIPLFGKFIKNKLLQKILNKNIKVVNILLDKDAKKDIISLAERFFLYDISVGISFLNEHDPSEMGYEKITKIIKNIKIYEPCDLLKLKMECI